MSEKIKYLVSSGGMKKTVTLGIDVTLEEIASTAIKQTEPNALGLIVEISGGKYVGDNVVYISTERLLKKLGLWAD